MSVIKKEAAMEMPRDIQLYILKLVRQNARNDAARIIQRYFKHFTGIRKEFFELLRKSRFYCTTDRIEILIEISKKLNLRGYKYLTRDFKFTFLFWNDISVVITARNDSPFPSITKRWTVLLDELEKHRIRAYYDLYSNREMWTWRNLITL